MQKMNLGSIKEKEVKPKDNRTYMLFRNGSRSTEDILGVVIGETKAKEIAEQFILEDYETTKSYLSIDIVPVNNLTGRTLDMNSKIEEQLMENSSFLISTERIGNGAFRLCGLEGARPRL